MKKHLDEELPFIATENIMMHCVKKGGDRQLLHEAVRELSTKAAKEIKLSGGRNTLIEQILSDERFDITESEMAEILDAGKFTGLATLQTRAYVKKVRDRFKEDERAAAAEITV